MKISAIHREAFWSKVDIKASHRKCWPWLGAAKPKGYGNVRLGKKYYNAPRLAFELIVCKIPDGLVICHTCDNPKCCNPYHIVLGTKRTNSIDMLIKGRGKDKIYAARGSINGNSKLDEQSVKRIRQLKAKGSSVKELALKFKVSKTNIREIINNKIWRHV